jgi:hypothetical protein
MGMLMDFYAGDEARIVAAWHDGNFEALEAPDVVAAHADLSFHLGQDELDHLVAAACALAGRPPVTFEDCLEDAGDPQDSSSIQRMTDDFRDLLAGLTPAQVEQLVDRWVARWPAEPPAATRRRGPLRALLDGLQRAVVALVLAPAFGLMWLSSRSFREARRLNQARLAAAAATPPPAPVDDEPTREPRIDQALREAVAALAATCRTARAKGTSVLYAWSL